VARTAMWIAETGMKRETASIVHHDLDFFPLRSEAHIAEDNALRLDWRTVCPAPDYIIGNPPFVGARLMNKEQKDDLLSVFGEGWKNVGNLDYVSGWYKKAAEYIQGTQIECAFVSTNSICQGQQVPILWPALFARGIHINFAHQTFKWSNEARGNAAVYCIIVGFSLRNRTEKQLFLYDDIKGEGLFSAAEIARLKNTVSLPCGKRHGLYKRVPRTNATVFEN